MRDLAGGLLALTIMLAPGVAQGEPNDGMSPFGYVATRTTGKGCLETLVLDQATFIRSIPTLKALGVMNADYVSQTIVNTRPFTLSWAFLMNSAPDSVDKIFAGDPSLQQCSFRAMIRFQDDYGNDTTETAFSFDITRALYAKVNWGKIDAAKFRKIAPHFALSPSLVAEMAAEHEEP